MHADLEFDPALVDRIVPLNGAHNFRHVAGWRTEDGAVLAPRRLYRASSLHLLDEDDLSTLGPLAVGHIFDLRTAVERSAFASRWPGDPSPATWVGAEGSANADLTRLMRLPGLTAPALQAAMLKVYADFPEDLGPALKDLFEALHAVEDDHAVLIHCAAGKDRTGFVIAMLLRALGVREQDIRADYLLTNATFGKARAIFASVHGIDRLEAAVPGAAHVLLGAHPMYLDSADAAILSRWGSHDAYLSEVVGLTPAFRECLRSRFLSRAG